MNVFNGNNNRNEDDRHNGGMDGAGANNINLVDGFSCDNCGDGAGSGPGSGAGGGQTNYDFINIPRPYFKSRFKVTPHCDIESLLNQSPSSSSSNNNNNNNTFTITSNDSRLLTSSNHNNNNGTGGGNGGDPSASSLLFEMMNNSEGSGEDNSNTNTNTVTTTTSSNFTFYKYRKLVSQNDSIENVYLPIYIRRPSHHSVAGISFYNERVLVYNFLQRPTGLFAVGYHIFVSLALIFCLVLTIISTSSDYSQSLVKMLNIIDYLIVTFFIVEFLARLWSSEIVSSYQGWKGKIRFFKNPIRIIDLLVIIISLAVLISNAKGELLITSLRGARFIQIFQMVRLDFKFRPWRMMASVVYSQRIHLAIVFYMGFLALIFISFLIYFVEKDYNEDFESLASSMWWAIITLCTIGYGDMYPKTSTGKLLACICSVIGVSIFALPAGILGTGLALKVQEQQRQLKISKRKQPAARLIQSAWRLYKYEKDVERFSKSNTNNNNNNGTNTISNNHHNNKNPIGGYYPLLESARWKRFDAEKRNFTLKEMNCVVFLYSVKFCIAKRDFVRAFKPYDIKDVLEQYAAGHADMLAKIRLMDNRLEKIQTDSYYLDKKQYELFKSRYNNSLNSNTNNNNNNLECEIQKIQYILNDLIQYQANSRIIIENLLKYLIDQQSLANRRRYHNHNHRHNYYRSNTNTNNGNNNKANFFNDYHHYRNLRNNYYDNHHYQQQQQQQQKKSSSLSPSFTPSPTPSRSPTPTKTPPPIPIPSSSSTPTQQQMPLSLPLSNRLLNYCKNCTTTGTGSFNIIANGNNELPLKYHDNNRFDKIFNRNFTNYDLLMQQLQQSSQQQYSNNLNFNSGNDSSTSSASSSYSSYDSNCNFRRKRGQSF